MDSIKNLPGGAPSNTTSAKAVGPAPSGRAQPAYESDTQREIQARATQVRQGDTAPERTGLRRLGNALASGQGLRRDVPRGYYLNITV